MRLQNTSCVGKANKTSPLNFGIQKQDNIPPDQVMHFEFNDKLSIDLLNLQLAIAHMQMDFCSNEARILNDDTTTSTITDN
jgi:hypothetical protein